MKSYSGMTTA